MQTVAWFFKPFWDSSKVEDYARKVVQDEKRYFARAQGIPFVGIYMNKPNPAMNKPAERFREELRSIRKAGSQSFGLACPKRLPDLNEIPNAAKFEVRSRTSF
jgi:hypothetical protein